MKPGHFIILFALLFIINVILPNLLTRNYEKKLFDALGKKDFDTFDKIIDKTIVKFLFNKFNIEYLKLNEVVAKEDQTLIEEQFALFNDMRMSQPQKEVIYTRAFNYFVSIKNDEKIEEYYSLIHTLKNTNVIKDIDVTYDIVIKKGYKYLEEIEEIYNKCNNKYKVSYAYLLSLMYRNKGDNKKATEFEKIAVTKIK